MPLLCVARDDSGSCGRQDEARVEQLVETARTTRVCGWHGPRPRALTPAGRRGSIEAMRKRQLDLNLLAAALFAALSAIFIFAGAYWQAVMFAVGIPLALIARFMGRRSSSQLVRISQLTYRGREDFEAGLLALGWVGAIALAAALTGVVLSTFGLLPWWYTGSQFIVLVLVWACANYWVTSRTERTPDRRE